MITVKEVIIVEGKYDKAALEKVCKSPVFTTDGFRIFRDAKKREFFKRVIKERGIIILTDSDRAGFMIRNYIKGFACSDNVRNAYIPEVFGKEKRKASPSKEGKIGVEGFSPDELEKLLLRFASPLEQKPQITKRDLYDFGLYGADGSSNARTKLCEHYGIPSHLSVNALTDALNVLTTKEEFYKFAGGIQCTADTD